MSDLIERDVAVKSSGNILSEKVVMGRPEAERMQKSSEIETMRWCRQSFVTWQIFVLSLTQCPLTLKVNTLNYKFCFSQFALEFDRNNNKFCYFSKNVYINVYCHVDHVSFLLLFFAPDHLFALQIGVKRNFSHTQTHIKGTRAEIKVSWQCENCIKWKRILSALLLVDFTHST